jgi:hypothetical protein
MNKSRDDPPDNLVWLDRSPLAGADLRKIQALGEKQRLLYRWFRYERQTRPGLDRVVLYSGARSRTPYAAYRVERDIDGTYSLLEHRTNELLASGRTIDEVLDRLPDNFFYSV